MSNDHPTLESLNLSIVRVENRIETVRTKQDETRKWQIFIVILTPLATAVLGGLVWLWQSQLQQHIDEQTRELTTRLALTEEFYRRKLTVYEKVHQQTTDLTNALNDVRFNPASKKLAIDSVHTLYVSYSNDTLYLSEALVNDLANLVDLSAHLPALDSNGKTTMQEVGERLSSIEREMKSDLHVDELGKFPGRKIVN